MRIKQIISAIVGLSVSATLFAGMSVVAEAAETELFYENSGVVLSGYHYTTTSNVTYELNETGKEALAEAQQGDTLVISYNIESSGPARYRNGIKLAGKQIYVNCHTETSQGNWRDAGDYHLNVDFSQGGSAEIKYIITLNDDGTASKISASVNGGTSYDIDLSDGNVESFVLNTQDRKKVLENLNGKLTNFKATLVTTEESAKATVAYDDSKQFTEEEGYTGNATAVTFTVTSEKTTETINVGYGDNTKTLNTQITDGEALCGIIVEGAITVNADNFSEIFTITID